MSTKTPTEGIAQSRFKPSSQSKPMSTQNSKDDESSNTILLDIYNTVRDAVLFFSRRVIFGPPKFKLLVSFAIIIVGSILKDCGVAPDSYLSLKTNIFNVYFAKLGWAWTIGLLGPFIYLTLITTHNHYQILTRHLVRLLIATGVWYVITLLFVTLEAYTGMCMHEESRGAPKRVCLSRKHEWQEGRDFSGHTFLLLYALLIINEEVKSYDKGAKKADRAVKTTTTTNENENTLANNEHERSIIVSKTIRILYVLLAGLTILWEFMLLSTALYFHYTAHKIVAAMIAVFFWYITYYVWYRPNSDSLLYPSTPKA